MIGTYSSVVGSLARGASSLNRRNRVEGCFNAAERKELLVRKNETRFKGESS